MVCKLFSSWCLRQRPTRAWTCACRLWDLVRFECVHVVPNAHADVVRCLAFATDAGAGGALLGVARAPADAACVRLLSGSYDGSLRVWRVRVPLESNAAAAEAETDSEADACCAQQTSGHDVLIDYCVSLRVRIIAFQFHVHIHVHR